MPHFICRWPGGDVLLASVDSRQELDTILQERCEPGVCKVARYHGPLVLELKPDVPGVSRASAERFLLGPACPGFQPAWDMRAESGDVNLLAADGSSQRAHKLVLQCRLPVLQGQPIPADVGQVRLACVPDGPCLHSLVQFLYLDDVQQQAGLTPQLHVAAIACGLQRLVRLCEARFAQQLEVQLFSWPGLPASQRGAVLDSFVGWCLYSEQLQREELRELCVHALARHVTAAQSRPTWSSLSEATASLVQLIAASTAPPLIHRQVVPDGSAVLPVTHHPAPAVSSVVASPVVSVEAEAFAAAGGRLTTLEWQQLQKFRTAVSGSLQVPEASPMVLDQQQLASSSLAAAQPHMIFNVKQPVLGPHKRLMDSVCRFAFPATHSLLASGWQLEAAAQRQEFPPAAPAASAATPRPAATMSVPAAAAAAAVTLAAASAASPAAGRVQQQAVEGASAPVAAELEGPGQAPADSAGSELVVPVPVPDVQPLIAAAVPEHVVLTSDESNHHGSLAASAAAIVAAAAAAVQQQPEPSSSSTQQPLPRPAAAALLAEQCSVMISGTGSSSQQPGSPAGPSGSAAGRYLLRSRMQPGSGGASRRSSHLRAELRQSWGSGVSLAGSEALAAPQQQAQGQQQEPGTLLPLSVLRVLQEEELSGCWGSGTISRQSSLLPGQQASQSQHQPHSQQRQHPLAQQHIFLPQLVQAELDSRVAQQPHMQQQAGQLGLEALDEERSTALGLGNVGQDRQREQLAYQQVQGEAQPGMAAEYEALLGSPAILTGGASRGRLLDLPAFCLPGSADRGSCEHSAPSAATTEPVTDPNSSVQVTRPASAATAAATGSGAATAVGLGGVIAAVGTSCNPLPTLQRALVEDFVLYEEASAARQHVVGILVSIEHGDIAAGQRLLAPACGELIAATAPAPVPNRLAAAAAAGTAANQAAGSTAVMAAVEHCKSAKGISKLLGMASTSRAALEPLPAQLQRQQRHLLRALQRIGSQLPGLSRMLASYQLGNGVAASGRDGADMPMPPGPFALAAMQEAAAGVLQQESSHGAEAVADRTTVDLEAAMADLLSLPELAQGVPVLLTQEQHQQRQQQVQQLASRAVAVLRRDEAAQNTSCSSGNTVAFTGAGAGLGTRGEAAAVQPADSAMAAAAGVGVAAAGSAGGPRDIQAGLLFSSILASLGAAAASGVTGNAPGVGPVAAAPTGRMQGRLGAGVSLLGTFPGSATGALPAAAPPVPHTGALGLLGAGGAPGPADGLMAAAMGGASGSSGMFTPTGVGALLAGGLLAEGGVAGDSILEDMAADVLLYGAGGRRITCHGMYELCAAVARPVSDTGGSPAEATRQPPQHPAVAPGEAMDSATATAAQESVQNATGRISADGGSTHTGLAGHKRRLSLTDPEEQQSGHRR